MLKSINLKKLVPLALGAFAALSFAGVSAHASQIQSVGRPNYTEVRPVHQVSYQMPQRIDGMAAAHARQNHNQRPHYNRMYQVAKSKLGHPYAWGGNGPYAYDCSGFTQYIYRKGAHKHIPRTAGAQYYAGHPVSEHRAKRGDLVFFGPGRYNIKHVGMVIGKNRMIDAQNRGVVTEAIHAPWWHLVGFSRLL